MFLSEGVASSDSHLAGKLARHIGQSFVLFSEDDLSSNVSSCRFWTSFSLEPSLLDAQTTHLRFCQLSFRRFCARRDLAPPRAIERSIGACRGGCMVASSKPPCNNACFGPGAHSGLTNRLSGKSTLHRCTTDAPTTTSSHVQLKPSFSRKAPPRVTASHHTSCQDQLALCGRWFSHRRLAGGELVFSDGAAIWRDTITFCRYQFLRTRQFGDPREDAMCYAVRKLTHARFFGGAVLIWVLRTPQDYPGEKSVARSIPGGLYSPRACQCSAITGIAPVYVCIVL